MRFLHAWSWYRLTHLLEGHKLSELQPQLTHSVITQKRTLLAHQDEAGLVWHWTHCNLPCGLEWRVNFEHSVSWKLWPFSVAFYLSFCHLFLENLPEQHQFLLCAVSVVALNRHPQICVLGIGAVKFWKIQSISGTRVCFFHPRNRPRQKIRIIQLFFGVFLEFYRIACSLLMLCTEIWKLFSCRIWEVLRGFLSCFLPGNLCGTLG